MKQRKSYGLQKCILIVIGYLEVLIRMLYAWLLKLDPATFDKTPDQKIDTKRLHLVERNASTGSQSWVAAREKVPCPFCGLFHPDWSVHKEWHRARNAAKRAADLGTCPEHTCVDRPHLPCDACWKSTGDPFATVHNNPDLF